MKDWQLAIIIFDAALYLLTFLYWALKLRRVNAGLVILLIMTISHVGAIFYYFVLRDLGVIIEISILPFIFLYTMILMNLYPLLTYKGITRIDTNGINQLIILLSIFVIAIGFEPLMENIKLLFSSKADYSELYDAMRDGELDIYSAVGKKLMRWSNHFRLFTPLAFFYLFSMKKKRPVILIGLSLCMVNYVLFWINKGTRGGILSQFLMYFLSFILLMPLYNRAEVRKLFRWIVIALIPMSLIFAAITLSRYNAGNNKKSLLGWILLYTSEGPIKFNNEMWDGEHNTNGDVNLCYLKSLVGMKTYTGFEERDEHYLAKNGRRIEVFYTYVGDFVSDFGVLGAAVVCLILTAVTIRMLPRNGVVPFHYLLFILFVCHTYSIGFASNIYRSNSMQKGNFYMFIVFLLMSFAYSRRNTKQDRSIQKNINQYN